MSIHFENEYYSRDFTKKKMKFKTTEREKKTRSILKRNDNKYKQTNKKNRAVTFEILFN